MPGRGVNSSAQIGIKNIFVRVAPPLYTTPLSVRLRPAVKQARPRGVGGWGQINKEMAGPHSFGNLQNLASFFIFPQNGLFSAHSCKHEIQKFYSGETPKKYVPKTLLHLQRRSIFILLQMIDILCGIVPLLTH